MSEMPTPKLFIQRRRRFSLTEEEIERLEAVVASPEEGRRRVERARILLAWARGATYAAIAERLGVTKAKVKNTLERARAQGVVESLSDRHRRGRPRQIPPAARAWILELARTDPATLGYARALWTFDLLAEHARAHCRAHGHPELVQVARNTVLKILAEAEARAAVVGESPKEPR